MKILIITNYYPPYSKGGYEISCKDTCDYLGKEHEVFILCGKYGTKDTNVYNANSFFPGEVMRILEYIDYSSSDYLQKSKVEFRNLKKTSKLIEAIKPDLIYIWNQQSLSIAPSIAAEKSGIPIVYDFGDFWYRNYLSDSINSKIKKFVKAICPYMVSGKISWKRVISVSNWMGKVLADEIKPLRLSVIPRGVDMNNIQDVQKNDKSLSLIFSGRLDEKKGLHICIDAVKVLRDNYPELSFHLNVFGAGDEGYVAQCLNKVIDHKLEEYITFNGKSENISNEYAKSHILLMPTMATETFGRVVIEAMAHEVIVISSNRYGPSEIIEDGVDGFLIDPLDSRKMSEIIYSMYRFVDKREEIAHNAKIKVLNKYNLDIINKQREKVLREEVINHA